MEYPNLDQAFFKLFGSNQCRKSDAKINVRQEGAKLEIEAVTASEVIANIWVFMLISYTFIWFPRWLPIFNTCQVENSVLQIMWFKNLEA